MPDQTALTDVNAIEPPPSHPRLRELLLAFHSPGPRWPGASRAALTILIPGAVALMLGQGAHMLTIALGAFAVIYGEGRPFRSRWRVIVTAGVCLVGSAMSGAFIGRIVWTLIQHGGTRWWLLVIAGFALTLAVVVTFVQNALRLPMPGGFFFVMVGGGGAMMGRGDVNPLEIGAWASVGALVGLAAGMTPALLGAHRPEANAVDVLEKAVADFAAAGGPSVSLNHQAETALSAAWNSLADAGAIRGGRIVDDTRAPLVERTILAQRRLAQLNQSEVYASEAEALMDTPNYVDLSRTAIPHARPTIRFRIFRSLTFYSHATLASIKVAIAGALAAVVGLALQFDRPDWAVVSVLVVMQWGPDRVPGTIRGVQRLIGSLLGIAVFAAIHSLGLNGWTLLLVISALQYAAEIYVPKNYAFAVIFITPLALLMGNAANRSDLGWVVLSRTSEVAVAVAFSLLLLWVVLPHTAVRHHRMVSRRCAHAMATMLGSLMTTTPESVMNIRRDLQFELLGERRAAQSLAHDHPQASDRRWQQHLRVQRAGYSILDFCSTNENRLATREEIGALARQVRAAFRDGGPEGAAVHATGGDDGGRGGDGRVASGDGVDRGTSGDSGNRGDRGDRGDSGTGANPGSADGDAQRPR